VWPVVTPAEVMDRWPIKQAQVARLVSALAQSSGRVVPLEVIAERMFDLSGARVTIETIRTAVKHARKSGVPVETLKGIGYRMTPHEMNMPEGAARP
jgi:DNA-binding response OmpR family regulator